MTFLQPYILWGLPLILLPVIIHLINRLRHRPQPWAAMRFLVAATRSSTSQAKLRQWLILLFRVLAVLMLILFLSRPLAGGWLGWSMNSAPDAIVILLDRSASMETRLADSTTTRREHALSLLAKAVEPFAGRSHLVVIDSASRQAQPLARPSDLRDLPATAATDTSSDFPSLFQAALTWLEDNQTGTAELWIASDLQRTNWKPDDERWETLRPQLSALQSRVRLRLLAVNAEKELDTAVTLQEAIRTDREGQAELLLAVDIFRPDGTAGTIPVTVNLDGTPAQFEVALEGGNLRWRQRLKLGTQAASGWGMVELPADANLHNNRAWFVYGPPAKLRTTIVAEDPRVGRWLAAATTAAPPGAQREARIFSPSEASGQTFDEDVLVLWQAPLPSGDNVLKLESFVQSGGVLVFLPPAEADAGQFARQGWGPAQKAPEKEPFRIERWEEREGPLAKTEEGFSLPVNMVSVIQRQQINGDAPALAGFTDNTPFLTRQSIGRGQVYFLASLPSRDWSALGEGHVLVPFTQRLLLSGSRRLTTASLMQCGELTAVDQALPWESVEGRGTSPQLNAGIYRAAGRLAALNRGSGEDSVETASREEVTGALSGVNLLWFAETGQTADRLQGEVWRLFVTAMLLFLVIESLLVLPGKAANTDAATGRPVRRRREAAEVAQ